MAATSGQAGVRLTATQTRELADGRDPRATAVVASPPIGGLTVAQLRRQTNAGMWRRGLLRYAEEHGRVVADVRDGVVHGRVVADGGEIVRDVTLRFSEQAPGGCGVAATCACPAHRGAEAVRKLCKHAIAVALAALAMPAPDVATLERVVRDGGVVAAPASPPPPEGRYEGSLGEGEVGRLAEHVSADAARDVAAFAAVYDPAARALLDAHHAVAAVADDATERLYEAWEACVRDAAAEVVDGPQLALVRADKAAANHNHRRWAALVERQMAAARGGGAAHLVAAAAALLGLLGDADGVAGVDGAGYLTAGYQVETLDRLALAAADAVAEAAAAEEPPVDRIVEVLRRQRDVAAPWVDAFAAAGEPRRSPVGSVEIAGRVAQRAGRATCEELARRCPELRDVLAR